MLKGFEDAFVYQNNDIDYIDAFVERKGNYILQMIGFQQKK